MAERNLGGRPRELKDAKVCSFTLDAASRKAIEKHARHMKKIGDGDCSKSEALRDLIARGKPFG